MGVLNWYVSGALWPNDNDMCIDEFVRTIIVLLLIHFLFGRHAYTNFDDYIFFPLMMLKIMNRGYIDAIRLNVQRVAITVKMI